jgi:spore coat polysaccharide biosynthesis protein SpsF
MKIVFVIQARLTSTRFPDKVVKKIGNRTILDWIISAITNKFDKESVILAIPENQRNEKLFELYSDKIKVIKGSENDVASRFVRIANMFDLDYIIRVCSDNPFLQTEFISKIYETAMESNPDYISYYCNGINCIRKPIGFFAEGYSVKKIKKLYGIMSEYDKEHVTPIFYDRENNINIKKLDPPKKICEIGSLRFTLDNKNDLKLYRLIFKKYPQEYYNYSDLINIINTDKEIYQIMKKNYLLGAKD